MAFGVDCPKSLGHIVQSKKVKIITNQVIYKLLDELKVSECSMEKLMCYMFVCACVYRVSWRVVWACL